VAVADSKKLYTPRKGIGVLEETALAFVGQRIDLRRLTYARLRASLGCALSSLPWHGDFPLPWQAGSIPVEPVRRWLSGRECDLHARIVEPEGVNRRQNKSDLLFGEVAELVRAILEPFAGEVAEFRIGKQGGRRRYAGKIAEAFGVLVEVEEERSGRSSYRFRWRGSPVHLEFLRDAEDRDFLVALASILAKYLREGAMKLFNEFWTARVRGVRRTAGYGLDGLRFFREIRRELDREGIPSAAVLRER